MSCTGCFNHKVSSATPFKLRQLIKILFDTLLLQIHFTFIHIIFSFIFLVIEVFLFQKELDKMSTEESVPEEEQRQKRKSLFSDLFTLTPKCKTALGPPFWLTLFPSLICQIRANPASNVDTAAGCVDNSALG